MKRQRKNPAKKVAKKPRANPRIHPEKFLRAAIKGELRERAKQIPLAARLAAAELKAARLEEEVAEQESRAKGLVNSHELALTECNRLRKHNATLIEEHGKFAKEVVLCRDTIKLRDEAIDRKEKRIKELMEQLQRSDSQVVDQAKELNDLRDQIGCDPLDLPMPPNTTYRKVLEAEVEARKRAQEERDLANKRAVEDESTIAELANEVARLQAECDRLSLHGSRAKNLEIVAKNLSIDLKAVQMVRDKLKEELAATRKELAEFQVAEPNPYHQEKICFRMTVEQVAEFVDLFKPRDGG